MNKRLKRILAFVCIVSMLFVLASCKDGKTVVKRKKKVVIVKDPETTQTDDNKESTNNTNDDYYFEDDFFEDDDEEETEQPKVVETPVESKPKYEVDLVRTPTNPLNEEIGMCFYHFVEGQWDASLADTYGAKEEEFLTYYRVNNIDQLRNVKNKNGLGWWYLTKPWALNDRANTELPETWMNNMLDNMNAIKYAGLWDYLAGFETEEWCLAMTSEQFRTATKWVNSAFPDKRIFSVLSGYEVSGAQPTGFNVAPMSYEAYGYVTDIGFDSYTTYKEEDLRRIKNQMLDNLQRRNNVRVWFFPTAYRVNDYTGGTSEKYVTDYLNTCYKLLLECENPGGLYLYTWAMKSTTGIQKLLDPNGEFYWKDWGKRIIEVGKEMRASDYRYDYSIIN